MSFNTDHSLVIGCPQGRSVISGKAASYGQRQCHRDISYLQAVRHLQPTLLVDIDVSVLVLKGNQGHAIASTVTIYTLT